MNNEIVKIYVFNKEEIDKEQIFNKDELKLYENVEIENIKDTIFLDDNLSQIKYKIIKNIDKKVSTDELYLFSNFMQYIDINNIYENYTQDNTIVISYDKIYNWLKNIQKKSIDYTHNHNYFSSEKENIEGYTYNELFKNLNLNFKKPMIQSNSLGLKIYLKRDYPFVINPYNNNTIDNNILKSEDRSILTYDNNLLFEYGRPLNNTIYVCIADELLKHSSSMDFSYILKLYFPKLYTIHSVKNSSDFKNKISEIRIKDRDNKKKIKKYSEIINYFNTSSVDSNDIKHGIKKMKLTIYPINTIKLPLDILFKIINSSKDIPYIKYNPGKNKENIYRLFTDDNITTTGKKIPMLYMEKENKYKINNLSKIVAVKQNHVGFYIRDGKNEIFCEFLENGNIIIHFTLIDYKSVKEIEKMLDKTINEKILKKVNEFLSRSGYSYLLINSLSDNNVVINSMEYIFEYNKDDNIVDLNKYVNCLSSIYNIENGVMNNQKDVIKLTYKRVSSYDKMAGITAYITNKKIEGESKETILKLIMENFNINDKKKALRYISDWEAELQLKVEINSNKRVKLSKNPGFQVEIRNDYDINNELKTYIKYENIDNINYLDFIKQYTLVLIDKFIKNNIKSTVKNKICKKESIELEKKEDIVPEKSTLVKNNLDKTGRMLLTTSDFQNEINELIGEDNITNNFDMFEEEESSSDESEENESDDDDMDSDDEALTQFGGDKTKMNIDLQGITLQGQGNYFINRMRQRQPKLVLKQTKKPFKSYAKVCPSQYRRIPVIVNDEELNYINKVDKESNVKTKSYDEYVTSKQNGKNYHYICPRFWCLRDDNGKSRSLSLEQVNNGECGGWDAVIPEGAKKVPKGKRIFEFNDKTYHREGKPYNKLVYKQLYPSFGKKSNHPDNLCVPCCYKSPNTFGNSGWQRAKDSNNEYLNNKFYKMENGKKITTTYNPIIKDDYYNYDYKVNPPTWKEDKNGKIDLSSIKRF